MTQHLKAKEKRLCTKSNQKRQSAVVTRGISLLSNLFLSQHSTPDKEPPPMRSRLENFPFAQKQQAMFNGSRLFNFGTSRCSCLRVYISSRLRNKYKYISLTHILCFTFFSSFRKYNEMWYGNGSDVREAKNRLSVEKKKSTRRKKADLNSQWKKWGIYAALFGFMSWHS